MIMKKIISMALCTALLMIMSGCSKQTEVGYGESFTVKGVIVSNESSFPSYCLKLDKKISITLSDGEYSEEFDCDTLYFYDEPYLNGNYNYSQLEDKKCTVTAELENYRGGGELFLLDPTIVTDEKEDKKTKENKEEIKSEISKNFIGRWKDMGIGHSAPDGALRWDVEFRSDGTGTFYFIYESNDIVETDFSYSTYDTYLGERFDGILIEKKGGRDISFMTTYTWSNELQKMLMTMYEVDSNGAPDLDVYWVYENN
ncbi:MAG: hypothetical protein ACI4K7_05190 [Oscillospiraceae bacterium]